MQQDIDLQHVAIPPFCLIPLLFLLFPPCYSSLLSTSITLFKAKIHSRYAEGAHDTWCLETETMAQTVGRRVVMASIVEEGFVFALTLTQSISNPALSKCHGCSCIPCRVHTTNCSTPTCFVWKMESQLNWPCSKIMSCALWYGSYSLFFHVQFLGGFFGVPELLFASQTVKAFATQ